MNTDFDILISGGGLNGPLMALAAAQAGLRTALIDGDGMDAQTARDFDGRAYALALASVRMLRALGLWPELAPHAQPMLDIKASDGHAGQGPAPLWLHFDHAEIEEGPMGYMLEDRYLRPALLAAVEAQAQITRISGAQTQDHIAGPQGVSLKLSTGQQLTGRLLICAEGRAAPSARRAGINYMRWDYGQTALVCAIDHDAPHHGIAHQFFMPAGPLAILPLPGNRSSIVWSETASTATAISALNDSDYLDVLRPRFGDFLGDIRLCGARFAYPLGVNFAQEFYADRLALIGDAAHGMHPIAGQGLNAGLRDIAALAQLLEEGKQRGEDIGSTQLLRRYQEWRRFDVASLIFATDTFNRLFSNDNPLLRLGRDIGMGLVGRIAPLRRGFIREAAGLTGDLPRLMRG